MDIAEYFNPPELPGHFENHPSKILGKQIRLLEHPCEADFQDSQIALLGVKEDRFSFNAGCAEAPDNIREHLYKLTTPSTSLNIIDLGNLKSGKTVIDTYYALREIMVFLKKNNVIPIITGGSQDITYGACLAMEQLQQEFSLVSVDADLNLVAASNNKEINSGNFMTKVIKNNQLLKHYINMGIQIYYTDEKEIKIMDDNKFEYYRLGEITQNMQEMEPVLRDADCFSMNISAVRQADAPGNQNISPNGLSGEQACQLARYAGLSNHINNFGLFEVNPSLDRNNATASLAAQIIWYFIEGFHNRNHENPAKDVKNFKKFIVRVNKIQNNIVFYKNNTNDRWWYEIIAHDIPHYIACSYQDYLTACNDEIPERWWIMQEKIC